MPNDDYTVNGIVLCPTESQWLPQRPLDIQGDGRPLYSGVQAMRLTWEFTSNEEWAKAQEAFKTTSVTGSAVVELPAFPTTNPQSYAFREYSGVVVGQPAVEEFFAEHVSGMVLLITNIVVE